MKRWWKWLLTTAAVISAMPLVATIALVFFVDTEQYKIKIADAVEERTGRRLAIDGALKLAFAFPPKLTAEQVRYPNPEWASREWAAEIDKVAVSVNVWTLLRGGLRFADISLFNPKLWVEKDAAGNLNLFYPRPPNKNNDGAFPLPLISLEIDSAQIFNGNIEIATDKRDWDIAIAHAQATSSGFTEAVTVDFVGAVEGVPVQASATGGGLKALIQQQPSPLNAVGWVGDEKNIVRAVGGAQNVLRWRGVDLALEFDVADTEKLSPLAGIQLPDLSNVTGSAQFFQPQRLRSLQLRAVDLQTNHYGIRGTMRGDIGKVVAQSDIAFNLEASGVLDDRLPAWARETLGRDEDITVDVTANVRGSAADLKLRVPNVRVHTPGMLLESEGEMNYRNGVWLGAIPAKIAVTPVADSDDFSAHALASIGAFRADADLVFRDGRWRYRNVRATSTRTGLNISAHGAVEELSAQPAGHFQINAAADGRGDFLATLFPTLPLTEAALQAEFKFGEQQFSGVLNEFSANVFGIDFTADGVADALHDWREVDIKILGRANSVDELPEIAEEKLPSNESLRLEARLVDGNNELHLTDIDVTVTGAPYHLKLTGEIKNIREPFLDEMIADLSLETTINHGSVFRDIFEDEIWVLFADDVVPVNLSAKLYSSDYDNWTLRDLAAESAVQRISVSGEVDLNDASVARLNVTAQAVETSRLPDEWDLPKPLDGKLDATFALTALPEIVRMKNLTAEMNAPDVTLMLRGDINNFYPITPHQITLAWDAATVSALNWNVMKTFQADNATAGDISITPTGDSHRSEFNLTVGESDLRGAVMTASNGVGMKFNADLNSTNLNLRDVFTKTKNDARIFSPKMFNLPWLKNSSGEINFTATAAANQQFNLTDVKSQTTLSDRILTHHTTGKMGAGELNIDFSLDAKQNPPAAKFTFNGEQLNGTGLALLQAEEFINAGTINADIELTTTGNSVAGLAAASDGHISLRWQDARMKNRQFDRVGGDILSNLVVFINPFRKVNEEINIECGVLHFTVNDGIAVGKNSLAMKTDKVTILGGGGVDFHDESLRILMSPKARKGFGINSSSIAKIVRLGGTFAAPKLEADGSRLFETGAAVWAALYTGGWSLLAQGLFDRNRANADVCGVAAGTRAYLEHNGNGAVGTDGDR